MLQQKCLKVLENVKFKPFDLYGRQYCTDMVPISWFAFNPRATVVVKMGTTLCTAMIEQTQPNKTYEL